MKKKLLVWLLPLMLAAYGMWVEPNWFEVTHHVVGKTDSRRPINLVQLSDMPLTDINRSFQTVIDKISQLTPDIIVLSGDVVDKPESLPVLETLLTRLGNIPKVAIPGNWEYWSKIDLKALAALYARHNVTLLINDCMTVTLQGRQLNIVGLDDTLAGKPDLQKARCAENHPAILIEHSPEFFGPPLTTANNTSPFLLNLSGHTHGGQIALFGHPVTTPPGSGNYIRGWYNTNYGPLYISRGIGLGIVPVRLGARPEIAQFEIYLENADRSSLIH